jgi:hypothetical protein
MSHSYRDILKAKHKASLIPLIFFYSPGYSGYLQNSRRNKKHAVLLRRIIRAKYRAALIQHKDLPTNKESKIFFK